MDSSTAYQILAAIDQTLTAREREEHFRIALLLLLCEIAGSVEHIAANLHTIGEGI